MQSIMNLHYNMFLFKQKNSSIQTNSINLFTLQYVSI